MGFFLVISTLPKEALLEFLNTTNDRDWASEDGNEVDGTVGEHRLNQSDPTSEGKIFGFSRG